LSAANATLAAPCRSADSGQHSYPTWARSLWFTHTNLLEHNPRPLGILKIQQAAGASYTADFRISAGNRQFKKSYTADLKSQTSLQVKILKEN